MGGLALAAMLQGAIFFERASVYGWHLMRI
jgi:hypothetical protein